MSKKYIINILLLLTFLLTISLILAIHNYGDNLYNVGVYGLAVCGDALCDSNESCSTCSSDCGSCQDGSNGGGSGGSGIVKYPVFYPTHHQLEQGYKKSLRKKWRIKFKFKNKNHTLTLEDLSRHRARINVSSESIIFDLNENQTKNINLDNDEFYDLEVYLQNITGPIIYDANLILKLIEEESLVDEEVEEGGGDIISDLGKAIGKSKLKYWIILGVIVLVVVVIIANKIIKKKKEKKNLYF
jgi:hypothetical protein